VQGRAAVSLSLAILLLGGCCLRPAAAGTATSGTTSGGSTTTSGGSTTTGGSSSGGTSGGTTGGGCGSPGDAGDFDTADFYSCGCSGTAPFCGTGRCLQCRTDADCPASAPRCNHFNECVPCLKDSDCGAGWVCNPDALDARPVQLGCIPDCRVDGGTVCYGTRCDPATGRCSSGCSTDSDCPTASPTCVDGGCIQCAQASDCPFENPGCWGGYCG